MGLYQRCGSRFWWMTYTMNEERCFESTKTTSKEIANKIWKQLLKDYELPAIDPGVDEALNEFMTKKKASFPDSNV